MKKKVNWTRILTILGVIVFFAGTLDPLEGSILIALGTILMTISTHYTVDRHRIHFVVASVLIIFGAFFLFYLSSLGGFGGSSTLSWWWGILILPYPIGWFLVLYLLILKFSRRKAKVELE